MIRPPLGFVFIALLAAVGLAMVASASDDTSVLRLTPGQNVVTWNGAEPYPIADFADTPVAQAHRWDAVRQEWLSYVVGRDEATLPERHLLPRVQYLLIAEAKHEFEVPDPVEGIDPYTELRLAAPPDDPLRFEAYWPNEDSPLEDLILLRSDVERLSVKAEVAGGVGEVEVYWVLDGRLNHRGLASDDVELLSGKHDDARLFASDEIGQVVFVELPRVVKLPPFKLAEPMIYGVTAYDFAWPRGYRGEDTIALAAEAISRLGLTHARFHIDMWVMCGWNEANCVPNQSILNDYDQMLDTLDAAGLTPLPLLLVSAENWASPIDVTQPNPVYQGYWNSPVRDLRDAEEFGRAVARRFPQLNLYELGNEVNIHGHFLGSDPLQVVLQLKALALGVWYENPDAVIVSASLCCMWWSGVDPNFGVDGVTFLEAMYEAGFGPWHDIAGIHYIDRNELDRYREMMARYGEHDRPLWHTEDHLGAWGSSQEDHVRRVVNQLESLTRRDDVQGIIIYTWRDQAPIPTHPRDHLMGIVGKDLIDGDFEYQPPYYAIQDFLRALREKQAAGE